jgi:hypothetical protein
MNQFGIFKTAKIFKNTHANLSGVKMIIYKMQKKDLFLAGIIKLNLG